MIFISLGKMRKKPDKQLTDNATERMEGFKQKGIKILNWYWTLGRYDVVVVFEAPDEKEALKFNLRLCGHRGDRNDGGHPKTRSSTASVISGFTYSIIKCVKIFFNNLFYPPFNFKE